MPDFRRREKPIEVNHDAPQTRKSGLPRGSPHLDGMVDHAFDPGDRRGHVWGPGRFVEAPGYGLDGAGQLLVDGHPCVDEFNVGEGGLSEECRAVEFRVNWVTVLICRVFRTRFGK